MYIKNPFAWVIQLNSSVNFRQHQEEPPRWIQHEIFIEIERENGNVAVITFSVYDLVQRFDSLMIS